MRTEEPGGARPSPLVGWTPAHFGDDLSFNVTSIEAPDSDPAWAGLYDVPPNAPTSYYKWLVVDGEIWWDRYQRRVRDRRPGPGGSRRNARPPTG